MSRQSTRSSTDGWWQPFFDDDYASWGLSDTPTEIIRQTVEFLVTTLELEPGAVVFDQCCGIGRLSLPLGERGVSVIGIEQSETYVKTAQREAEQRALPCRFFHGDAFEFVAPEPCDAAFNWFTSFGYSADDATNVRMLDRAFESLKPGGRFALDFMNLPQVFGQFKARHFERSKAAGSEGLLILYETEPDFLSGMMNSDWTLIRPDGRRETRRVSTRLLLPSDLVRMFHEAGFEDVRLYGWIDGEPLTRLSRRCIVVGRKPT
jgi:SAM-dependent methyltransferase